mmetsp:Transcript_32834/g.79824  ORF Transcript_32834/g.79824 Transcript_32834/m.79824 type:complete len:466 (-) Transcript_32834:343-1740(-)
METQHDLSAGGGAGGGGGYKTNDDGEENRILTGAAASSSSSSGRIVLKMSSKRQKRKRPGITTGTVTSSAAATVDTINCQKGRRFPGKGLPTFKLQRQNVNSDTSIQGRTASETTIVSRLQRAQHEEEEEEKDNDAGDEEFDDVPTETLVAVHSIIQSDQGLYIPLSNNESIQAVLEAQILSKFNDSSSSVINSELHDLVSVRYDLVRIPLQGTTTTTRYAMILTDDYVHGVWDAHCRWLMLDQVQQQKQANRLSQTASRTIVEWFVINVRSILSLSDSAFISSVVLEQVWDDTGSDDDIRSVDVIRHLMDLEILVRDSRTSMRVRDGHLQHQHQHLHEHQLSLVSARKKNDNLKGTGNNMTATDQDNLADENPSNRSTSMAQVRGHFQLWLPTWGQVLKAWSDGRRQIVQLLARAPKKELSKMNILKKNRHPYISTQFLLDDLVRQGKVQITDRPFGSFVKLHD